MNVLNASQIGFSFGEHKLFEDSSFTLEKGKICAILGPNGAGKTTLLRCILKTHKLGAGNVLLKGQDIRTLRDRDLFANVSYVPQGKQVPGGFTVRETVTMGLSGLLGPFGTPGKRETEKVDDILRKLGLTDLSEKRVHTLSGGELQLTLIARALVKEPELLILDEPESGLDFKNQLLVLETLREQAGEGLAVLFNTHYPEHAFRYADTGILLFGDGTSAFGPISEIITEENIKKAFGVDAWITELNIENTAVKSVVPIKII